MRTGTHFFSDAVALELLQRLVREEPDAWSPGRPLRVWVPQCSTGQDAYSVAIRLIEALGSRWREIPVRVFGTDPDEDSVSQARAGRYSSRACQGGARENLGRFLILESDEIKVRPSVRSVCRFVRHALPEPPPFSRLNLIVCRDTLASMTADERAAALRLFHRALAPEGFLLDQTGGAVAAPELFHPVGSGRAYAARGGSAASAPPVDVRPRESARREKERDAFVDDVVHELRSPLALIRGSAETLLRGVCGTRTTRTYLGFIESHAQRMARLVDRLLDLSVAGSPKAASAPVPVSLSDVLWEAASTFAPAANRRRLSIKIDVAPGLTVLADRADLGRAFGNLLDNALKFTPRGGKVFISGAAAGAEAIVSIRDTGRGIAPGDLSRVFERFFRAEGALRTKGTGLGLAIVRGIVEGAHGRIWAENAPAGGAVFHVALPRAPEHRTHD
ncbi:MAG TPA: CheR family methyltransferase [Elusimicrobiota bacterium]|nr:CheR family methyltransferase [Elusimicrobiota bacterium]